MTSTPPLLGSLIRSLLTLFGSFLIGHTIFGHVLVSATFDTISGVAMTAFSIGWSFYKGQATEDTFESMIRQLLQGAGGLLVGSGLLNATQFGQITAFVILGIPMVWGYISKMKTAKIAAGHLTAQPTGRVTKAGPPPGPTNLNNIGSKTLIFILLMGFSAIAHAQFQWTSPFATVKKSTFSAFEKTASDAQTLNTVKVNLSLPGYYYSNGKQQSAVVGLGIAFEHYKSDTLIYSVGPYLWYNSPVPTGSTQLPIGYGAAAAYKGLFLVGFLTPDFVHWGPVVSLDFSFGNGGISLGGFNL